MITPCNNNNIRNNSKNKNKNIHCSSGIWGRLLSIVPKFQMIKLSKCMQWLIVGGFWWFEANYSQFRVVSGWFQNILGGFGQFLVVSAGFGWFWVVCCFSSYHNLAHQQTVKFIICLLYCKAFIKSTVNFKNVQSLQNSA